jgi:hypothetical protein
VLDFALVHLPPPPAPVLEIGAGRGDLARQLVARGYQVFAWDRVAGSTAQWLFDALRRRPSPAGAPAVDSFGDWYAAWVDEHAGLHGFERLMAGLNARFTRRWFGWVPYLAAEYLDPGLQTSEQALIDGGAIQPSGFRYVGRRR